MKENLKILEALRGLSHLLRKKKEWGGRVNCHTGEIEGLREGKGRNFSINPKEERAKGTEGWRVFHAHPANKSPIPSVHDFLATHLCGAPGYLISAIGICEMRPLRVLPLEEVVGFLKSSAVLLEAGTPAAYLEWENKTREFLPVEVSFFEWLEEPTNTSEP